MHEFLGVRASLDVDLEIAPRLVDHGSVTLKQAAYQLYYDYQETEFTLRNLATAEPFVHFRSGRCIPRSYPLFHPDQTEWRGSPI